ncbi:MAG: hypothetical protein QFE16_04090 [Pseudomonadota bacterium]|nr:hypothetical protein [Pseudomonadota bacterium]
MSTLQSGQPPLAAGNPHPAIVCNALRDLAPPLRESAIGGVPSGRHFIALLEAFRATGGTAPGEIVGRLLEEHHVGDDVSLARLVYTGQVFGFEWRSSLWIPMFQFDVDDLSVRSGPQQVRAKLPTLWSGWRVASWFAQTNVWLDGQRPVDVIALNLEATLRAADAMRTLSAMRLPMPSPSQRAAQA